MRRMLAISDIHGELDKLNHLLKKAKYRPKQDQLILLGDYVDRGPNPRGVLKRVMELKQRGAIVLKGNHDDWMVRAFSGDTSAIEPWLRYGGIQTLKSYQLSVSFPEEVTEEFLQQTARMLADLKAKSALVRKHLSFIEGLDCYYETEDTIFVHGGVHPVTPLAQTEPRVLFWIREEFHQGYGGEKTVVFGHTTTNNFHDGHDVYFGENRIIGIDGGAVFGGRLNCLELPSKTVYFVE